MRLLKITLNNKSEISIDEGELVSVLEAVNKGVRAVICKRGIFNPAYFIDIKIDTVNENEIASMVKTGYYTEEKAKEVQLPGSQFSKILKDKFKFPQIK